MAQTTHYVECVLTRQGRARQQKQKLNNISAPRMVEMPWEVLFKKRWTMNDFIGIGSS
jgi:hypothetical protein